MNRFFFAAAFAAGAAAIAWVAAGYAGAHGLALAVTLLIAAAYGTGALELQRYRAATATLQRALATPPAAALEPWLQTLHPSLREPVRRRIDGERGGLPAPALTPYLVGLLVLLGMAGTFLGMVVTLQGTVAALESTADLQAMRSALAAPVRGLGLAFGTSVAGVIASAMLGLMSALARRERLQAAAALDEQAAAALRPLSAAHRAEQRDEARWAALQQQAARLPELVQQVQVLMDRLAEGQERFHRGAEASYTGLAASVERSLAASLAEGARLAGATLQPLVGGTMERLSQQAEAMHARVAQVVQSQADASAAQAADRMAALTGTLAETFDRQAQALAAALDRRLAEQQAAGAAREAERLAAWTAPLQQVAADARTHAEATIAEVSRLMQAASEAPRVAAEVIGQLREQQSASAAQDHALLEERRRLLEAMATLLQGIEADGRRQREAIDGLLAATRATLEQQAGRFEARLEQGATALQSAAAQGTAGAVELAALAEAFGQAVLRYGDANDRLLAQLHRVEAALDQAAARGDEQMAYVVAQAREVIDLSLLSQKQVLDELQALARREKQLASVA